VISSSSDLRPGVATDEAFRVMALDALDQIVANTERLTAAPTAQAIHQARVGVRRLRSALSAFRDVIVDPRAETIAADLKDLASGLAPARDLDVFLAGAWERAIRAGQVDLAGAGPRLAAARAAAYRQAAATGRRAPRLLKGVRAWIDTAVDTRIGARPAEAWGAEALDKGLRRLGKHGPHSSPLKREQRHRLRIRAKRLRYLAEAFVPMFDDHPKRADRFMEALKDLSDRLGDLNDIAIAERLCGELGAPAALIEAEARREARLIAAAREAFDALGDARVFWPPGT